MNLFRCARYVRFVFTETINGYVWTRSLIITNPKLQQCFAEGLAQALGDREGK